MGITKASAPGKLILCGEHAVVYGRPAIALPLNAIRAEAQVSDTLPGTGVRLVASDVNREWTVDETTTDALGKLTIATLRNLGISNPDITITLDSDILIAAGMGSGAAVATALVRALSSHFARKLPPDEVSALVYISEQRYHGTPSGIDNTVIAYEQPVWYVKPKTQTLLETPLQKPKSPGLELLTIGAPLPLVLADTGVRSKTSQPVSDLRQRWQNDPNYYESLFDEVESVVRRTRDALVAGDVAAIGPLLNENQTVLESMGISSPELERLVTVARESGALGAKLSGGGWGGIILALVTEETSTQVADALRQAGASYVVETTINSTSNGKR